VNLETLLKQARAARRRWHRLDDKRRLHIQGMSPGEFRRFAEKIGDMVDTLPAACVVGWEGITEADLCANASDEPVPFSAAAFAWWLDEHQEHLEAVFKACWDACEDARSRLEEASGKPQP
jgi:hypothetical protein